MIFRSIALFCLFLDQFNYLTIRKLHDVNTRIEPAEINCLRIAVQQNGCNTRTGNSGDLRPCIEKRFIIECERNTFSKRVRVSANNRTLDIEIKREYIAILEGAIKIGLFQPVSIRSLEWREIR